MENNKILLVIFEIFFYIFLFVLIAVTSYRFSLERNKVINFFKKIKGNSPQVKTTDGNCLIGLLVETCKWWDIKQIYQ